MQLFRSVCALLCGCFLAAAEPLAPTPPMGWNSWDSYGTTVTEAEVKANADFLAKHLLPHGWRYVVVDIQWSELNPKSHGYRPEASLAMDANGRLIPAPNRFPSSASGAGFKPLADYIHAKGLRFGFHIMRGIPRQAVRANTPVAGSTARAADVADHKSVCPWNTDMYGVDLNRPGGQDYYDSLVKMYAAWGADFIKADDMSRPLHAAEIEALHRAIVKSGRPIVLSLSPGPADVADASFLGANAQMWRVSNDFWDRWVDLRNNFDLMRKWTDFAKPGNWPDGDMLPLGHIGLRAERGNDRMSLFTPDEQRTLMTLWSVARSPLMFGGDLPTSSAATLDLITNDEVLAANQSGTAGHELFRRGNQVAWTSGAANGSAKYVALFNVGDQGMETVRIDLRELGLPARCEVRDLWAKRSVGTVQDRIERQVPAHGAVFLRVTASR